MTVTAGDALAGLDRVVFPATVSAGGVYTAAGPQFAHSYTFTLSSTAEGTYQVAVYDRAGNDAEVPFTVGRDAIPPYAAITVPARSGSPTIPVEWGGNDQGSGMATYDVQVRADDGEWTSWLTATTATEAMYSGELGHRYTFHVRATDHVNNTGAWAGASTIVVQVTKYYPFSGQRIAMRAGGVVYYLHGDHLGSVSLVTNESGNRVGELHYTPYGVTRYEWGSTPTNRRYTGQSWEGFGLYDYGARMYSPSLGRFISADTLVPEPGNPQSLNRYSYVLNNPLRYTDPSGLITQQEAERAQEIISLLQRDYRVFVHVDFGWRILPVMHPAPGEPTVHVIWEEGMWQLAELELLFEAVRDLASVMGGAGHFRENLGGVWVERAVMRYAGLGAAHRIVLNAGGFTKWTVVHELAHAWDAAKGWRLSREMQRAMGAGFAHPVRHFFDRDNPDYWYDPGQGPPPCGVDANFNRKEDFAEAVAAYVYSQEAQQKASARGWPYVDPARGYNFADFYATPRGQFINALMVTPP